MTKKQILDKDQISQIIKRIAYQLLENNMKSSELVFVGVCDEGNQLSKHLQDALQRIAPGLAMSSLQVDLNKAQPKGSVQLNTNGSDLKGKNIVIVDDVLNTGKTLAYALIPLLDLDPQKIEIVVLVDRGHRQFPVSATFSGYELATTLEEHIEVQLGETPGVYLY